MLIKRIGLAELAELNKDYAGKPDPFSEQLETAPENPKAAEAREELKRWHRFPGRPWTPPDTLTEAAIDVLADQTNIWLDHAINLMVFGQIDPNPPDDIETVARRQQALNAICNSKKFSFIQDGTFVNVPEDTPQSLWPATKIREAADFIEWLRQLCGAPQLEKQSNESTQPKAIAATAPGELILSGRGAMTRAIEAAFHENFATGIPPGTSSQERDDKIRETVKRLAGRGPNKRTIQRALKKLPG
jgi:hypothetical protein